MKYKQIRNEYQHKFDQNSVVVDKYAEIFSPFFTKICLKIKLLPNEVTILMVISGIIGAILYSIPYMSTKVIGIVFIHMWYILDLSDGEVARINKKYSHYGTEIDYMAHTINHPLFIISFALSSTLYQDFEARGILLYVLLVGTDSFFRMTYSLSYIESLKSNNENEQKNAAKVRQYISFACSFFTQFPNFALIYPIVQIISESYAFVYLVVECVIATMLTIHAGVGWLKKVRKQ